MHGKKTNGAPDRPAASEAAIREMHDKASAAAHRAAQHDTNAIRIVGEAEAGAEQMRRDAETRHNERMEHARKMAADMIAAAEQQAAQHIARQQAEADDDRMRTEQTAEENLRQAYKVAQAERDNQAAEQRDRDYWTSLASSEAAAAGLPAVPPTSPMDTVPDPAVTRTDGEVAQ